MRVKAYYSAHPADPAVFHDDDECPAGRDIPWWNRRPGTDERPRCEHCTQIAAERTPKPATAR